MIRPEYRALGFYGRDWRRYRLRLIELRGARCSKCRAPGAKYLNLAHTTHDPRTSSVALLCPACHARHDVRHRLAIVRAKRAAAAGQSWLIPETAPGYREPAATQRELFT